MLVNKLHYKGDHRKFNPKRVVGPDQWGAWYLPVTAHYFDGVTTIFYKPVPPDKLPPQCHALSKQVVAQQQIGRTQQCPPESGPSPKTRLPDSSLDYQVSRRSGGQRKTAGSGGSKLTKSQRELLKRFRKPESR
jgi:hypothetical protein